MEPLTSFALDEPGLRQKLGIPGDARQVLLFAESSHWDPNWLRTSQEYFQLVAPGLEQAVQELRADPRRVYSIECMFFLRLFWESRPDLQHELRELLNTRRLRLTGSGVTTPDTLIPSDEAILRDLLLGQEWLRSIGVTQEPSLAYFPDCFGHSPALPALLNAAGFDRSAVTRIDGMWFMSADLDLPSNFPLRGSSAEHLLKTERCLDFTWRAPDGSQVLCHWNAFTYGQGDMLASSGQVRIYLYPKLSRPDRTDKNIARRVSGYLRQLAPLSRTPYLFCPIGWDFNPPIHGLGELLDRYNRVVFPDSGVWLVNAGLDDYFDLIEPYRAKLPVLSLDPNPYWTGFYTARPSLKQRAFRLVERLLLCEQLGLLAAPAPLAQPAPDLRQTWWAAAVANHHDFITGTAPDRVAYEEQAPMLDEALRESRAALDAIQADYSLPDPTLASPGAQSDAIAPAARLPEYTRAGGDLRIVTRSYDLTLSPQAGGRLERLERTGSGESLFAGPSLSMIRYDESGGLWRMGYEYRGGRFRESNRSLPLAEFTVSEQGNYLCVTWQTGVEDEILDQIVWVSQDDPLIYLQVTGRAPLKSTLVQRFVLPFRPATLIMEAPGGQVARPTGRVYRRPFWPVQRFLHLPNPSGETGFAVLLRFPGAVAVGEAGQVEMIALRNAIREKAYFDRVNLLGMPATGIERERVAFQCALAFPRPGEETLLLAQARALLLAPWSTAEERLLARASAELVQVDSDRVFVTAVKPAWRGEGLIIRLSAPSAPLAPVRMRLLHAQPRKAWLCDARERDIKPLDNEGQELVVPMDRAIVTVRVV